MVKLLSGLVKFLFFVKTGSVTKFCRRQFAIFLSKLVPSVVVCNMNAKKSLKKIRLTNQN